MEVRRSRRWALSVATLSLLFLASPASGKSGVYHTFADYPGFDLYYADRCRVEEPVEVTEADRDILERFRPRLVLPPGGSYPIDFYRDYLPFTLMRRYPQKTVLSAEVTGETLAANRANREAYLDFQLDRYRAAGLDRRLGEDHRIPLNDRRPVIYGRVYREWVAFPDGEEGEERRHLTFLKYNLIFATSGLPADLPLGVRALLWLTGFDRDDWHELDNFVAVHIVLDEGQAPVAVILAQHNHHRTYLLGKDLPLTVDGRLLFDIALRSNEIYPASDSANPVKHRVIRWNVYLDYLLSGEDPPALNGNDVTYGVNAGGREIDYDITFLSPCDLLYTAEILLGEPRPFFWIYLGRDGPPGSDYYNVPLLLPLGNILKFSYLHDGDPDDIRVVREAIDRRARSMDIDRIMEHGGKRFLTDWRALRAVSP